jgi:Tol biopolymer transport system component
MGGEPLARFEVPDQLTLRPSNLGHEVLAVASKEATSVHIMPVDGGPVHAVTEGLGQDEVLCWSGDGQRLLIRTELDGEPVLFLAQRSGGTMHQIRLPDTPLGHPFRPILSPDGDYLLYAIKDGSTETAVLKVYGIDTGQTRVLTRETMPWASATGAGGVAWRDGRRFLYTEKIGENCAFRASTPEGPSELLVTLPCADVRRDGPAVHGDRIAYARDSTLYLIRAGETRARALISLSDNLWAPVWSHDGSRLAVAHHDRDADRSYLVVLGITPDDRLASEPLILDSGAKWWWNPQWMPDDSAVLVIGMVGMIDGAVWTVPVDPGEPATPLTLDEGEVWEFVLSPDGRHIAFSKEAIGTAGSSIWRVDLSEAFEEP